ncbi:MAG: MraY family glycosyltransferase [Planctomycetota bacterium]
MPPLVIPILALIPLGIAISLPMTAWLVRAGHAMGTLDSEGADGHEKTLRRVPNIGGIAIYLAVAIPMLIGLLLVLIGPIDTLADRISGLADHVERLRSSVPVIAGLLGCLTVLHIMGLIDDRRGMPPWPKLIVQIGAAAVMVIAFDVRLLELLGPIGSCAVTILWIIVVTNAMNFMDNMDGLAGGVGLVAAALLMIATLVNAQWFIAATLALLIGGLIGFLVFNRPPARIFMGDGGSLVLGFLLAVLTARTTFYDSTDPEYALGTAWYGVFMPIVILAIPLYDFITVTALRLSQGRSPFVGDQQHFSHRLVMRGLSERDAVLTICGAALVTGIGGISLGRLVWWQAMLVGVQTLTVLFVILLVERSTRHIAQRDREQSS